MGFTYEGGQRRVLIDKNRQSMHRANPYTDSMTARDVRRSTVVDDGGDAFGVVV